MTASPFDLSGRRALVTGASSGIGQAIAVALAQAGADIVGTARSPLDDTRDAVTAAGRRFEAIRLDLSNARAGRDLVEQAWASGPVDILVNNAGTIRRAAAEDFTEEDWDDVMNVNLKALFFATQAFGRRVFAEGRRGKVVNVASLMSFQGGIRIAAYTASKGGLAGITRLLANEWAARGINVNAIAPGYVETANTAALRADAERSADILKRIPAGRWAEPADMGGAAVFLSSGAADYVHGILLPVDGGWLAR